MSGKRSRATFEADLTAQQSPYVLFGTPLPPLDPEVRDDGSYVPVWKQEVRDEKGRKRLHGAFTGGWSAGYFNTVGSKEGWTPSTFVSSRTSRRKDDPKAAQQRLEDFMDEEDLADAEEAKNIQTNQAFAGLGLTADDGTMRATGLMGLFRVEGETIGKKLLQKMGWREGQGIGPKVRRAARLEMQTAAAPGQDSTYLFAPDNVSMIRFDRKMDRKGLGFAGERKLTPMGPPPKPGSKAWSDDEEEEDDTTSFSRARISTASAIRKKGAKGSSFGVGVLNDTGSDDEDPYEIGPRISYSRVIVTEKKKKKTATSTNPSLKSKPKFISSKKSAVARVALGVKKCHDGRLPLDGFVFGKDADALTSSINKENQYPPPQIPPGWKSSKQPKAKSDETPYVSTADAAKASTLDPKARAALLGEKQLPGKSVFDFMSASAREQLMAATGKTDLPPARGEIPAGFALSEEERRQELLRQVPKLDKGAAVAALSRGTGGGAPYADNDEKRARYRGYLEYQAGFVKTLPLKPPNMREEDWLRECHEFFNCARIFKPMTGLMASRFTTSTSASASKLSTGSSSAGDVDEKADNLLSKPPPKPQDPAEEAAKMGLYGPMTRSVADFYPTRLLCKRFNVRPPAHVQPDQDNMAAGSAGAEAGAGASTPSQFDSLRDLMSVRPELLEVGLQGMSDSSTAAANAPGDLDHQGADATGPSAPDGQPKGGSENVIDSSVNEALEAKRAGEEVFRAIFGDSDDEED